MMGWQVTSVIHGGQRHTAATREQYMAVARALHESAADWRHASSAWSATTQQLARQRVSVPLCSTLASGAVGNAIIGHATLPYDRLISDCNEHAADCMSISRTLDDMAALLIRAHSLYSESESWTTRVLTELVQGITTAKTGHTLIGTLALAAGGVIAGSLVDGRFNPVWALTATAGVQEGLMSGIGARLGSIDPVSGMIRSDEANVAIGRMAPVAKTVKDSMQGDTLIVREVTTDVDVVGVSSSVAQSMENLRRLAEERLGTITLNSGLDYATIAIQRYRREDGTVGWLVTIPGTDGEDDSPLGWAQNMELMSDDPKERMNADSARMVLEAMRQAGIGADEPVALIGHSQGGIVAAAIAADMADQYDIRHVVTTGSPIANHPIPSTTWVTSIEMDDELVAAFDGAANPSGTNWLTIHGYARQSGGTSIGQIADDGSCTPGNTISSWSRDYQAAEVKGASQDKELTHWLKYHQAAYQNATDLGSPAVMTHERHFQEVIEGELEETRYFCGRMASDNIPIAPSERLATPQTLGD